jgi:hypothetical protein
VMKLSENKILFFYSMLAYIDPSHRNFSHLEGSRTLKLIHDVDAIQVGAFVTSLLAFVYSFSLSPSPSLFRSRALPLPLLSRSLSLALSLSLTHTHTVAGKRVSNHALSAERQLAATLAQEVQQQLKGKD